MDIVTVGFDHLINILLYVISKTVISCDIGEKEPRFFWLRTYCLCYMHNKDKDNKQTLVNHKISYFLLFFSHTNVKCNSKSIFMSLPLFIRNYLMLNHPAEAHIRSTNISTQELYKSWIEISRVALIENIFSYKKIVSPAMLACVIKSNAYGHGMDLVAQLCDQLDIVDWLCVVSLSEAVALRKQAIKKPLLVLSILDQDLIDAVVEDIDVVICEYATALALNACASMVGKKARVHIKVDTGLSRVGVMLDEAVSFVQKLRQLPHLAIVGIFTHFATAEAIDQTYTNQQINHFTKILTQLCSAGVDIELRHSSCSAAITSNQRSHFTMARAGIGIFG